MNCSKNMHAVGVLAPAPCLDDILKVAFARDKAMHADRIPVIDRSKEVGGAGPRVCAALDKKLQGKPAALFPVPSGTFGDKLLSKLKSRGTCVSHILRYSGKPQYNIVIEYSDGKRVIYKGHCSSELTSRHYRLAAIPTCGRLLVSGSLSPIVVGKAIKTADRNCVPWAWNPSERHFALLRQGIAETASLIQMNDNEATLFSGLSKGMAMKDLVKAVQDLTGARVAIVTCGAAGAHGTNGDHRGVIHCPARSLNGRKTVGLGDRHFALVNWALCLGADILDALTFAAENV